MPLTVLMPALSPTMTEGHLVKWHKSVGDLVRPGDLLMDVETDKAVMEVEATQGGILARILVAAPTENVKIGHPLAYLKQEGESDADIPLSAPPLQENSLSASDLKSASGESAEEVLSTAFPSSVSQTVSNMQPPSSQCDNSQGRIAISPLARKIAAQKGVDISALQGTGPRGRIVKKDIDQATPSCSAPSPHTQAPSLVPLTGMRKVIAQRLSESKQTIPHFYLSIDCDADNLLAARQQVNEVYGNKTFSINDLVVCACARALQESPDMRLLWSSNGLVQHHQVDLAVAVSIEGGLITPIIPNAGRRPPLQTVTLLKDLIARARSGKLKADEYQGGTFTVSNLGNMGITHFQPIINPPHSGILAVGSVLPRPVVKNGVVTVGHVMTLTLAADHRVVDGSAAAAFLGMVKKFIEAPLSLFLA